MYSELLLVKICLEFEESVSQRAWASVLRHRESLLRSTKRQFVCCRQKATIEKRAPVTISNAPSSNPGLLDHDAEQHVVSAADAMPRPYTLAVFGR
jgi:hypothetical protein